MAGMPSPTFYHRWLGWHARAMRRAVVAACLGTLAAVGLSMITVWQVAVVGGWNVFALVFLIATWSIILRADSPATRKVAAPEDETHSSATLLLAAASIASLTAVGFTLHLAAGASGTARAFLIVVSASTVVVSWAVVNTVFALHYAHQYFALPDGAIDFESVADRVPDYRDFAYLAFTIGMTYQVSDTTLRHRRIRRTVLWHALLSYLFGVVIVAGGVNLIAGLMN